MCFQNFSHSVSQTIMLYTLNLYSDACQLCLNKSRKKIPTSNEEHCMIPINKYYSQKRKEIYFKL